MTTWFTADLHLGHTNIIRYSARPFDDAEAMNRALIDRWNETVDDVWAVGDFAMGKLGETLPLAGELRGRKVLLAGNHDRCWVEHGRRAGGWEQRYLEAGFAEVRQGHVEIGIAGNTVLASTSRTAATATTTTGTSSSDPSIAAHGCCTATSTNAGGNEAA